MDEITYDNVVEMEEFKNKKRKDRSTKINFNPFNGLPVTTLLTYEDVFGELKNTKVHIPDDLKVNVREVCIEDELKKTEEELKKSMNYKRKLERYLANANCEEYQRRLEECPKEWFRMIPIEENDDYLPPAC